MLIEAKPRARERLAEGLKLLSEGRYAEGWPLYEARLEIPELHSPPLPIALPIWQGEDLIGKRLVVFGEQGLGDQIMFARFIRDLTAMGAALGYLVSPPVAPLFPGSVGVGEGSRFTVQGDYRVAVGSLPHRLGITLDTIPTRRYVHIEAPRVGGVGIITKGNPKHSNDAHRSLPLDYAERLLRLGRSLEPEVTGSRNLLDTARLIASLDLVVTVDSAVAHLAGAMHKPVWILLPAHETDWRWLSGRADSPWYPTARLFRQPAPGDWESVFHEVESSL